MARSLVFAALVFVLAGLTPGARAQDPLEVSILYITQQEQRRVPLSLLDPVLEDDGLLGARAALKDNQTTGRFLKHDYKLVETVVSEEGDLIAAFEKHLSEGVLLVLADLRAEQLLALADLPAAKQALIFNTRSTDDKLRNEACRANVMHVMPSRAMKADALAQYMLWKKWRNWLLVHGNKAEDLAFAEALRRAARKFNAKIVEERVFAEEASSSRTDSGHAQIQKQMPVFTQGAPDHDILMVADEADIFGEYLPYRAWEPRPVAGTQGLVPTAWHRSHEQWGGTQMHRRFERDAKRWMTERDHVNWVAVRAIGEAVTRTLSTDPESLRAYLLGDKFKVPAFRGVGLTFRPWNQQMRQPILLAAARNLVSVSPQPGFLHQRTPLDTLGYDKGESKCRFE